MVSLNLYENLSNFLQLGALRLPRSCAEVKQFNPQTDGEYWLKLQEDAVNIRVYCHNITSSSPSEYITLQDPDNNYGHVYKHRTMGNSGDVCNYNGDWTIYKYHGRTEYSKIRLNISEPVSLSYYLL